jgi:uncharacterized SAM-binding protein YcdF (DUF218 family)
MRYFKNKKVLGIIFVIMGILSIINALIAQIYSISFSNFFYLIGFFLIVIGLVKLFLLNRIKSKLITYVTRCFDFCILLCLISFILIEGLILSSAFKKDLTEPDYIIVLGAGLWGNVPSLTLVQRLEASLDIINLHPNTKVILSGGKGSGETISEAEAMKKYLISKGISADRLIKEDKSTNTLENLSFSNKVIKDLTKKETLKVTIVTSNFHMYRAKLLASRVGLIPQGYPSPTKIFMVPTYFVREYLAIIKSLILDWPASLYIKIS